MTTVEEIKNRESIALRAGCLRGAREGPGCAMARRSGDRRDLPGTAAPQPPCRVQH